MPLAPAPWTVDRSSIHFAWKQSISVRSADGGHIAHLTRGYEDADGDPAWANAYLIAAAPDLYEALRDMCDSGGIDDGTDVIAKARAALAKARGETEK